MATVNGVVNQDSVHTPPPRRLMLERVSEGTARLSAVKLVEAGPLFELLISFQGTDHVAVFRQ